jgi:excinuclease ABC subunit C
LDFKEKLALVPEEPGCYLMTNADDIIIYVGKAKNLKNRLRSYFTGAHNEKTTRLVSEIRDFSFVVTNTEHESLILEANLIKRHVPKYNIRLVDDKTYPYIELTEERYPKLQVVRRKDAKGRLFGPYPNVYAARETARMLNAIYPFRKCETLPDKACLYYHIGQCLAPCIHKDTDYSAHVKDVTRFLKGDTKVMLQMLEEEMEEAARMMLFEKAAGYRDMIRHIGATTEKQIINTNDFKDRDAVSFRASDNDVAVQILMMRQGRIVDHHQTVFSYVGEASEDVMDYLVQYYAESKPDEILFDQVFEESEVISAFGSAASVPKIGDKKKLVDLAAKNAQFDLEHHNMLHRHADERTDAALLALSGLVGATVKTIEVFDNAQLFGTAPISAMIVYKDRDFFKSAYRKYHLTSTTDDDVMAMREVIYRRYHRVLSEGLEKPDLVLVDGSKGQVRAAAETLSSLNMDIRVAGLKKDRRHQLEGLVVGREVHILKKNSDVYRLLGKLSEEVHRFAVGFHRKTRGKAVKSYLDDIPGIGPARRTMLLKHFKTREALENAGEEELAALGLPKNVIKALKER